MNKDCTLSTSYAHQRVKSVCKPEIMLAAGRIAQLAEELKRQAAGETVEFVNTRMPASIVALHQRLTAEQIPIVQALCDELGYDAVILAGNQMCGHAA